MEGLKWAIGYFNPPKTPNLPETPKNSFLYSLSIKAAEYFGPPPRPIPPKSYSEICKV